LVTLTVGKGAVRAPDRGFVTARNLVLRVIAAALQIFATAAVVTALPPSIAGVYFKGVVIAYGLAALLRGKYDLFVAQHFLSYPQPRPIDRELVRGLGIRILIRSAIACAVLLVITSDLDVMEPRFRPNLETYLPFVIAVPFATLALFLSGVLRAINRTLSSTLVATYSVNVMILAVANSVSGSEEDLLVSISWAFCGGAVLAAVAGVLITRTAFPRPLRREEGRIEPAAWKEIFTIASRNGLAGMTLACLQWGPLCLLAILVGEIELAQYAVVTRTAQVIDFLIPAAILVPHELLMHSRLADAMHTPRGKLLVDLAVSLLSATACVLAVGIATPWIVSFYGISYTNLTALFVLLYATQWLNGSSRPAIRHLGATWDYGLVRRILFLSMIVAILTSAVGIPAFGGLGAALSVLAGTLLLNAQVIQAAFAGCRGAYNEPARP
jgi:O-antigen/teichoic acid export membrane protein